MDAAPRTIIINQDEERRPFRFKSASISNFLSEDQNTDDEGKINLNNMDF